jgi:methyl acetate hydrolase
MPSFFPGLKKSWSYNFMVNDEDAPTGRPAGAIGWAGLANLFFWIDRKNGFGGYWATQILPFGDPTSFVGYLDFETAAYAANDARGSVMPGAPFAPRRLPAFEIERGE